MKTLLTFTKFLTQADIERMADLGLDVTVQSDEQAPVDHPEQYEAVICVSLFKYSPIEAFTNLKFIQLLSAGFEFMPLEYLQKTDIAWYRAENCHGIPMAELALAGVLNLYRQRPYYAAAQREHRWGHGKMMRELYGKKVCIVGAGQIGTECAKRFQAMGCHVVGIARSAGNRPYYDCVETIEALERFLPESDIVILALPGGTGTEHLFNAEHVSLMKQDSVFVNIGRGNAVDEKALIQALQSGKLMGASLDVFEKEPLDPDNPLWDMENVILTPHCAASGEVYLKSARIMECLAKNLASFRAKRKEETV